MEVSFAMVEKILKTLPVGYYLKRYVSVLLKNVPTSYFNVMSDQIVIGYPMIAKAAEKVTSDEHIEEIVRGLLYHEISHVILTPKVDAVTTAFNIVEDERIESIFENFFKKVHFKKLVKLINDYHGEPPTNADEAFYQLVRYRSGEKKWLDVLNSLLSRYIHLTAKDDQYDSSDYTESVEEFYAEFIDDWNKNHSGLDEINIEFDQSNKKDQLQRSDVEDGEEDDTEDQEYNEEDSKESDGALPEHVAEVVVNSALKQVVDRFSSKKYEESLNKIFADYKSISSKNTGAINSYSGVFDCRSVVRDDYKFFVQQNRVGHVKQFDKLHLNLFIDVSGSFCNNETETNVLIKSLKKLEKRCDNFTFDVVTINTRVKLLDKNNLVIECTGGNKLPEQLVTIYNQVQKKGQNNINIIMFDGDCISDEKLQDEEKALKRLDVFNNKRTIMISDYSNKCYFDRILTNVQRLIYTNRYLADLFDNICMSLRTLAKS